MTTSALKRFLVPNIWERPLEEDKRVVQRPKCSSVSGYRVGPQACAVVSRCAQPRDVRLAMGKTGCRVFHRHPGVDLLGLPAAIFSV